ncbi:GntR family transcriptional regulator [Desulfitobacterium sp.]|uniref:GntR family transcriptional regulator n=1 Tax=Desulfitobacterium sp. TaxID=49981 RepID=UPI002C2055F0|nr:GntR family transcriptional regulator [Desulfitobacterium sp.]HVJ47815.1 GntR family transcriptional regulator [Desulfitobacterium sp.]
MTSSPVYLRVFEEIKEKINCSELKPGDILPPESALCKQYGASRATVRNGLALLFNEGYIYSIPGKGNFVQSPQSNKYTVYYDEMSNMISSVDDTKLLEVDIISPEEYLANLLQMSKSKNVILIRRLFFNDGEPIAYDVKYLPYVKGMPIVEKEIEQATLPEMLSKDISPFAIKRHIRIQAQIPNEEMKKQLRIKEHLALLVVEQKLFDNDNKPIGYGITYFNGDYIKLEGRSQ